MNFINNILTNISSDINNLLNSHIIYIILFFFIMTVASFTDIKSLRIYDWFNLAALISRFVIALEKPITIMDLIGAIVLFVTMFIIGFININNKIGGDIKYSPVFALWAGPYLACASFFIGVIMMLPVSLIRKGKATPLAPFLQLGIIVAVIIYLLTNTAGV